jgi:hypothetical protein
MALKESPKLPDRARSRTAAVIARGKCRLMSVHRADSISNEPGSSGSSLTSEFGLAVAGIGSRRTSQSESTLAFQRGNPWQVREPVRANAARVSNVRKAWSSDPSRPAWALERIVRKPAQTVCEALDVVPFGGEPERAAGVAAQQTDRVGCRGVLNHFTKGVDKALSELDSSNLLNWRRLAPPLRPAPR